MRAYPEHNEAKVQQVIDDEMAADIGGTVLVCLIT